MKTFLLIVSFFLPSMAFAEPECLDSKPNKYYSSKQLYLGKNHWLTAVGNRLIEIKNDEVTSGSTYFEPLKLMCGQKGRVIATTHQKILEWRDGRLLELPLSFKEDALASDGEAVYSVDPNSDLFALYVNKKGLAKKVLEQKSLSGQMYDGEFIWHNSEVGVSLVFKDGTIISKSKVPEMVGFPFVFDYKNCKGKGLYKADYDFFTKSRFGFQKQRIEGPIFNIDYPKGCGEYVVLRNDKTLANGKLWSLKPGKKLTFTPISTACSVDHFASNDDGSLYYRCGKQLYYKDKTRTKDVLVGEASKLQLTEGINDQWLASPRDGTLLTYLPRAKAKELEKVCFVRLSPAKLVDLGCF